MAGNLLTCQWKLIGSDATTVQSVITEQHILFKLVINHNINFIGKKNLGDQFNQA